MANQQKRPGGPPHGGPGGRHGFRKPKDMRGTLAKLMGYMAEYKLHLLLVALMLVISSVSTVAGSYLLKPLIND